MNTLRNLPTSLLLAAATVLTLAGCNTKPVPSAFNLQFDLDPSLAGTSLELDLVGANPVSDLPKWQTYSVSDYWQPGNVMRHDADKAELTFGEGKGTTQTFSSADPSWDRWLNSGATNLIILVDLPGISSDKEGNADPRRLIVPLDIHKWASNTLVFRIQESGIRLMTPMKVP